MPSKYDPETRAKAVRLVVDHRGDYPSEWAAIKAVSSRLGMNAETLRNWVKQSRRDAGIEPGPTTEETEELRRLRRENAELRRANEFLKSASAFFAAELDRPTTR